MISVSSNNDARNELGLGLVGLEEQVMEESDDDLEEESTHSYVSCVDPDVALSYIDEKLENVLGHFQKDFEGGVSAENLGAKFGGYGSFLSMYQRSPVTCSRPKSPPQVGVRSNCSASSVVPEMSISGSTSKAPASDVSAKLGKFVKSSINIGTPGSKQKSVTDSLSSAPSNHKTLKLRIKVGSSDLSSLKNVSTHSKQALDIPPSTSRLNCHSEVEEGLLYGICDSPTKILMAMVSFPLHKDQLLSPLSNDLIRLGQKEKIMKEAGSGFVNKSDSKVTQDILGVSDAQNCSAKVSTGKKEKLEERVKYIPSSKRLEGDHFVDNTENEADKLSCEELVSKTLKLPLLTCLSPSHIHRTKEIDKVSDSYVEGTFKERNNRNINAALVGSKPELEDNVVLSIKETESSNPRKDVYMTVGETLNSLESKSKREKAPSIEHVNHSSAVKVSQSETRNEEKILKSKLPKVQKLEKISSSIVATNRSSGKDAAVNKINKSVPNKLQEDNGGFEDVRKGFFDDSGESKEGKQSCLVLKAGKEKLSEENALTKSFNNNEEACTDLHLVPGPDLKHLIKSSDLNEDRHNTKRSARWEVKNNYVEGGMEKLEMQPERELSRTSKKQKTGKSRFSDTDQPGFEKIVDVVAYNKTMSTQPSPQKVKDTAKASSQDGHDDRMRKLMRLREATVIGEGREKVRKKKKHKDSSCDGKELPLNSENCDRDREVRREAGRDSASHLSFMSSTPGLYKDTASEVVNSNVHEAKGSLVESVTPPALKVLDPRELKSGISESDERYDANSNAVDTLKRSRDGEGYSTIDKPGTTKKAVETSKDHNLVTAGQATHSWDKERACDENCSVEKYKPKKPGRYSGENCQEGESQRKNREEESFGPPKDNNCATVNEAQDLNTAVQVKTKESRSKRRPTRKVSMESNKEESREYQNHNTTLDVNGNHFSSPRKIDREKNFHGKSNLGVTSEKLKNKSAPQACTEQVEVLGDKSEASNTKKRLARNDNRSVPHDVALGSQKQNGSRHEEHVGLSPLKKESTSQAVANSMKEARDLKHIADRLQSSGNHESTGVYFQAALKFLQGASLMESSSTEHATHKSFATSRHIYGSTAKLCEFCAHEYEKNKDMGAAALAYKCMEVAYLRITKSSHCNISRYRNELQAALQLTPSGESPSVASDGENSNQTLAADKVALSNAVRSSPRVTGNHVISSGNNSSLSQLLAFSQNVSFAMDASRKAQMAFAAAAKGEKSLDIRYSSDGITSIKRALDFNFQDMEKLLHIVRLAMESINR